MKNFVLLVTAILVSVSLMAQQKSANISWDKTTHDFGTFKEENGSQKCSFNFTNTGSEPLVITNVRASCGCTTPDWTKEPIQPGQKGYVSVSYDPRNRPGKFDKSITVTTNAENPNTMLRIVGNVTAREQGLIDFYPRELGELRMKSTHLAFVKVYNNRESVDSIPIVNMGEKDMKIEFQNIPSHLKVEVIPQVLKGKKANEESGQKGTIIVTYDGRKQKDFGFVMDRILMVQNGEKMDKERISISATIEEDFSHLTADERAKAPKVNFVNVEHDFGNVKAGVVIKHDFEFTNTGKSDLHIRKVKASCGCTPTNPEKMLIKPGETSKIGMSFNTTGRKGNQHKTITVITNDPDNPSTVLRVKGMIED